MSGPGVRRSRNIVTTGALVLVPTLWLVPAEVNTQESYSRGQNVSPAFEGWEENEDGSSSFLFGYMNRNWLEELDVPTGPDNNISRPCRSGSAHPPAPPSEPIRIQGYSPRRLGREGDDLDTYDQGQDRVCLCIAENGLQS